MAGTIVLLVPADVNNITVDETAAMEAWGLKTITLRARPQSMASLTHQHWELPLPLTLTCLKGQATVRFEYCWAEHDQVIICLFLRENGPPTLMLGPPSPAP